MYFRSRIGKSLLLKVKKQIERYEDNIIESMRILLFEG